METTSLEWNKEQAVIIHEIIHNKNKNLDNHDSK